MAEVVFLDTSILLNVLDVPGKNGERTHVVPAFQKLVRTGATLVLPVAAVVEVGNHIAQLPGDERRDRAVHFVDFLRMAVDARPPWVVSGASWDAAFLRALVDGSGTARPDLVTCATAKLGSGDASILLELELFRARTTVPSATPIRLWTLDQQLDAHG